MKQIIPEDIDLSLKLCSSILFFYLMRYPGAYLEEDIINWFHYIWGTPENEKVKKIFSDKIKDYSKKIIFFLRYSINSFYINKKGDDKKNQIMSEQNDKNEFSIVFNLKKDNKNWFQRIEVENDVDVYPSIKIDIVLEKRIFKKDFIKEKIESHEFINYIGNLIEPYENKSKISSVFYKSKDEKTKIKNDCLIFEPWYYSNVQNKIKETTEYYIDYFSKIKKKEINDVFIYEKNKKKTTEIELLDGLLIIFESLNLFLIKDVFFLDAIDSKHFFTDRYRNINIEKKDIFLKKGLITNKTDNSSESIKKEMVDNRIKYISKKYVEKIKKLLKNLKDTADELKEDIFSLKNQSDIQISPKNMNIKKKILKYLLRLIISEIKDELNFIYLVNEIKKNKKLQLEANVIDFKNKFIKKINRLIFRNKNDKIEDYETRFYKIFRFPIEFEENKMTELMNYWSSLVCSFVFPIYICSTKYGPIQKSLVTDNLFDNIKKKELNYDNEFVNLINDFFLYNSKVYNQGNQKLIDSIVDNKSNMHLILSCDFISEKSFNMINVIEKEYTVKDPIIIKKEEYIFYNSRKKKYQTENFTSKNSKEKGCFLEDYIEEIFIFLPLDQKYQKIAYILIHWFFLGPCFSEKKGQEKVLPLKVFLEEFKNEIEKKSDNFNIYNKYKSYFETDYEYIQNNEEKDRDCECSVCFETDTLYKLFKTYNFDERIPFSSLDEKGTYKKLDLSKFRNIILIFLEKTIEILLNSTDKRDVFSIYKEIIDIKFKLINHNDKKPFLISNKEEREEKINKGEIKKSILTEIENCIEKKKIIDEIDSIDEKIKKFSQDRIFIRKIVKLEGSLLKYINGDLKRDTEIITNAIKSNASAFLESDSTIKNNEDFLEHLVKENPIVFKYFDKEKTNNEDFILRMANSNINIMEYISQEKKNSISFFNTIVKKNGFFYKFADPSVKKDRKVTENALEENGLVLQYCTDEDKDNASMIKSVVKKNGLVLQYASKSVRSNKYIVPIAVENDFNSFLYADDSLKNDKIFVKSLIKKNGLVLKYVDKSLTKDKNIVKRAVEQNGLALQYADESLKRNKRIVITALKQNRDALKYVDNLLYNDADIVKITSKKI